MAAKLQTLPATANRYSAAQLRTIADTQRVVAGRWQMAGTQFDTGWLLVGPLITATVLKAQGEIAERADQFIPDILTATGQAAEPVADTLPNAFVGVTGAGFAVDQALSTVTIRAKQAVASGQTAIQAAAAAQEWLAQAAETILADTARGAEGLGTYVRPGIGGYIRMVHGGACGRCVVQAGKWFRTNQGFLRHPRCACVHIPASENVAGDWRTEPRAYFDSLTDAQQIKLMGSKANAQAVRDGADIGQIVNAYNRSSGMQFAQEPAIKTRGGLKFTTAGTTRQASAAQQQAGLRRNGPLQMRLMPETIAARAKNAEDRLRLLRLYGWIADEPARARGRELFAAQRRAS